MISKDAYDPIKTRPMKEVARNMVWDLIEGTAKRVLLFPGINCEDLLLGFKLGKINTETEFVLIEENPKIAISIRRRCSALGIRKFEIVNEHFSSSSLYGQEKFDLIFLDFCGEMTELIFDALKDGIKFLSEKIAMTFCTNYMNNPFRNKWNEYRKSFKHPANTILGKGLSFEHANWSCDTALSALGVDAKSLIDFYTYKDGTKGRPMVFFSVDISKKFSILKFLISR